MNTFDHATAIALSEGIAYVANGRSGLLVVDVKNPAEMKVLTAVALPGYCKGVYVHAKRLYAISHREGLTLFDLKIPAAPEVLGHLDISGLSAKMLSAAGDLYLSRNTGGMLVIPEVVLGKQMRVASDGLLSVELRAPDVPGTYVVQLSNQNGLAELDARIEVFDPEGL